MTALDLIERALKIVGLLSPYETLDAQHADDALAELNGIIDHWNIDKLKSYNQVKASYTLVVGQSEYTIGSGGDFDGVRPQKIEDMYIVDGNTSYIVEPLSFDQYNDIVNKNVQSYHPRWFYYNPEWPLGSITFYPVPSKAVTIKIDQWALFGSYANTAATVTLPPGFAELLVYQLASNMCTYYGKQLPPEVLRKHSQIEYDVNNYVASQWMESIHTTVPSCSDSIIEGHRTYISTGL